LNLVAIADGAKSIRCRLKSVFGEQATIILDWYHLGRKVRKLIGSIARNQAEKSEHLKFLCLNLWQGKATDGIEYLKHQVKTKNPETLKELITYFSKHQSEIINYQRRQQAGKPIGSGWVEKAVDARCGASAEEKGDELDSKRQPSFGCAQGRRIEWSMGSCFWDEDLCYVSITPNFTVRAELFELDYHSYKMT
jgi:hypothetical protein